MKKDFYFQNGGAPQAFGIEVPNIELASAAPILNAVTMPVDSGINTYLQFQQENRYKKQFEESIRQQQAAQQQQQIDNMYKQATMDKGIMDDIAKIPVFGRNADAVKAAVDKHLSQVDLNDHSPDGFAKRMSGYTSLMSDPAVRGAMRDQQIDKALTDQVNKMSDDDKTDSDFTRYQTDYLNWKNGTGNEPTLPQLIPEKRAERIARTTLAEDLKNQTTEINNKQTAFENKILELKQPLIEAQARVEIVKATVEEANLAASGVLDTYKEYEAEVDPAKKAALVKKMAEQLKPTKDAPSEIKSVESALGFAFEEDIKAGVPVHKALANMAKAKLQFEKGHSGGGGTKVSKEPIGISQDHIDAQVKKAGADSSATVDAVDVEKGLDLNGHNVMKGKLRITQSKKPSDMTGWSEDKLPGGGKQYTKTVPISGKASEGTTPAAVKPGAPASGGIQRSMPKN